MSLKNKRILISAGPTWIAIDPVRVISSIATGEVGYILSSAARKEGYNTTLLLGPTGLEYKSKGIRVKRFKYFDDLFRLLKDELSSKKYDIVINAAAVSDYRLIRPSKGKIRSGKSGLIIRLKPTKKIVDCIKRFSPKAYSVIFKLETGVSDSCLIKRARDTLIKVKGDLAVANKLSPRYKAFILDRCKVYAEAYSKQEMARKLFSIVSKRVKSL